MGREVSLLYVEDNDQAREHYANAFSLLFDSVFQAHNAKVAYDLYKQQLPDILLVDIHLPDGDGLELIRTLRSEGCRSLIIVLSAYSQKEQLFKAIELHLFKYLVKPIKNDQLLLVLQEAIKEVTLTKNDTDNILIKKDLFYSKKGVHLEYQGIKIPLSVREHSIIELLVSDTKRIFTFDELAYVASDNNKLPTTQAIKNMIHRLRKKVPIEFIHNHYGAGYQIDNK